MFFYKPHALRLGVLLAVLVSLFAGFGTIYAAVPNGFVDSQIGGALSSATAMEFAPDGRLFILQQGGQGKIIKNGSMLAAAFVSLTVDSSGERGLLGIAFDPAFNSNQYIYLYYTVPGSPAHNRISRFTMNGDIVQSGSEQILIDLDNLSGATNHNGGAMHFGPDGKLYIAVGENANSANAQTLNNRLGKLLRVNSDGSIPTDNPYFNQATGANRMIWAMGLRNPYTFAFQPGTGKLLINDVGQSTWEEINVGVGGSNYGWPNCEGFCSPPNASYKDPFYTYNHSSSVTTPSGCAITGGIFYNPGFAQFPASYVGKYFFNDYCSGWIYYIDPTATGTVTATEFATGLSSPVDLKVSNDGSLWYLVRGSVHKITYSANSVPPTITANPNNQTVSVGQTATFSVSASGTPPFTYQWQKNNTDIPGANNASYTTPATVAGDNGATYRCIVSNLFGSATSTAATLTVTTRQPPTANITSPANHSLFVGNQVISYAATASDAVDGTLPASAYSWTIELHHATHTHPFLGPIDGVTGGNFTIPTTGHTETNIFYRIILTVTNSASLTFTTSVDIDPTLVNLTVQTSPPGLQITVDGQPFTAPYVTQSVVGIVRNIGVTSPQFKGNRSYLFGSWSDSGTVTHDISTPANDTTYTATLALRGDTIGIYRPGTGTFYLRNTNATGAPDITVVFGNANDLPVTGDWNGDGVDSIGVYRPATGVFFLRNSNSTGPADYGFAFGNPGDTPIAGRWDNTMSTDGVGVYRPSNGILYLRKTLTQGFSNYAMVFGNPSDRPIAGDWDSSTYDSIGILRPTNGIFYLSNTVGNGIAFSDLAFTVSGVDANSLPLAGDWTGAGFSGVGYLKSSTFALRNTLSAGAPNTTFAFGTSGDVPLAGRWTAASAPPPQAPLILVPPGSASSTSGIPKYDTSTDGRAD